MERRGSRLSRRRFVVGTAGLGLVAGCGRLTAPVPQPARRWRIGFLAPGTADQPETASQYGALWAGLRDLGYEQGQNLAVEYRYADGQEDRLPSLAAELVQLDMDLIVGAGSGAAHAAQQATRTLPIVFPTSNEPVEIGLVVSLARPGGNVTGLSLMAPQLGAKRLELVSQTVPGLARVGVLANPVELSLPHDWAEVEHAAEILGVRLLRVEAAGTESLGSAFERFVRERAEALIVLPGALFSRMRRQIVELAGVHGLPASYEHRLFVEAGGLMAYGPISQTTTVVPPTTLIASSGAPSPPISRSSSP
jgi:putative ABC transport system substrate-binding protein